MHYQHLLFDLDGTLTDPGEGITNSVAYALDKFGIKVNDRTQLYPFIGPPLIESFMRFFSFSRADAERAVTYYREYFSETGIFENRPYDRIHETLECLRAAGKHLYLATSKPDVFAKRIVERFDLASYFDYLAGASLDEKRSEKWDVIRHALSSCPQIIPSQAVMIGDRMHDVIGAKKTGLDSIGVLWGYGSQAELAVEGATYIVKTQDELTGLLLK